MANSNYFDKFINDIEKRAEKKTVSETEEDIYGFNEDDNFITT